jgi:hypothetical protein
MRLEVRIRVGLSHDDICQRNISFQVSKLKVYIFLNSYSSLFLYFDYSEYENKLEVRIRVGLSNDNVCLIYVCQRNISWVQN